MPEGFSAVVAFALAPSINLWEKTPKPPSIDGGDPIDITTQHNLTVITRYPRALIDIGEVSFGCAYESDSFKKIMSTLVNRNGSITFWLPDGGNIAFWGYLRKFEPGELKIGDFPEAAVTIVVTNYDHSNKVEAVPVITPASGT